jgi:hypothetical protein
MAATIKSTINLILNIDLLLILCTNSRLLYKCLVKLGIMQEKRLIIDITSGKKKRANDLPMVLTTCQQCQQCHFCMSKNLAPNFR